MAGVLSKAVKMFCSIDGDPNNTFECREGVNFDINTALQLEYYVPPQFLLLLAIIPVEFTKNVQKLS